MGGIDLDIAPPINRTFGFFLACFFPSHRFHHYHLGLILENLEGDLTPQPTQCLYWVIRPKETPQDDAN